MLLIDIQYFGSIHYVKTLMEHKHICFRHETPFAKMSFKNRMVITSSQGPLHLTIPIIGGRNQKTPLKDVLIDYNSPWREQHFKAIQSCYKRSPYFEHFELGLSKIYLNKPEKLVDFLFICHDWLQTQLKTDWVIHHSIENKILPIVQYDDLWKPNNYNKCLALSNYQQVFSDKVGFIPNVCILDKLFCWGVKEINK